MARVLYFDPWSGASGDMVLAALLDAAGADGGAEVALQEAVHALRMPGVTVVVQQAREGGFACRRVSVGSTAAQPLRRLADLESLLASAHLDPVVSGRASAALRRLAEVEAGLHGTTVDEVHFHELGAVDTVVDVVGAFVLLRHLRVDHAFHGPVPLGWGQVETEHGSIGVPAPATLALLAGRPVYGGGAHAELTTPTGALLLTEAAAPRESLPAMRVEHIGYGAGRRASPGRPNLLRVVIGETWATADLGGSEVVVLQSAIDDATPEALARLQQVLLAEGAVDAWWTPVFMKKGRPGVELTLLVTPDAEARIVDLFFRESTSFGLRRSVTGRHTMDRTVVEASVGGLPVRVKVGSWGGRVVTAAAEYEDAAAAAERLGVPLEEVMAEAVVAVRRRERLDPADSVPRLPGV